ncbi:MAG: RNA polymerase sigma-70 factor [Chloroflexota bacterium]|nr:RNA polymerase sigma-70 factor [Chloroflexota bacterium]
MVTHAPTRTTTSQTSETEPFLSYRPLLFSIAYRMLSSVADAEDALQETWLRWHRAREQGEEIRNPKAWLTTTLSRICLDQLGSARVKREQYVGAWLPEPLAGTTPDVAETALDHESLSTAFLVLLESLSPKERAVFLLHDVFAYDFAAIAGIVGESETYCRQLARRARAHMVARRPRYEVDEGQRERLTARFIEAVSNGDMAALTATLADDVVITSDGGGKVLAARKPVIGRDKAATFLLKIRGLAHSEPQLRLLEINGQPGAVTLIDGAIRNAATFEMDGDRITHIFIVANPDKLEALAEAMHVPVSLQLVPARQRGQEAGA